jgi:ubiquinone/menaquinone biosynthesis C-methylase UbiE
MPSVHKERFTGVAEDYARYRPEYPSQLLERLADRIKLEPSSRLLDIGCGPGTIALALHHRCAEVIGLDINSDMLRLAMARAKDLAVKNVQFLERAAEDADATLGTFCLITIGRALHWMDREVVIDRAYDRLEPNGGLALRNNREEERNKPYANILEALLERYLGVREPWFSRRPDWEPDRVLLQRSRFTRIETERVTLRRVENLDSIIGHVYSLSSSKRELFGERAATFEHDLRDALLRLEPRGIFEVTDSFEYLLALKD